MARKKLIALNLLEKGNELLKLGVPMTKVHKDLGLDWSYQSTADVFTADRAGLHHVTRPSWLKASEDPKEALQKAPENWNFEGVFPNGKWIEEQVTIVK